MLILCLLLCSLPAPYGLCQPVQKLVTIEVMTITINIGVDTITRQLVGNIWRYGGEGRATKRGGETG